MTTTTRPKVSPSAATRSSRGTVLIVAMLLSAIMGVSLVSLAVGLKLASPRIWEELTHPLHALRTRFLHP